MKKFILGILLTAVAIPTAPVMARHDRGWSENQGNENNRGRGKRHRENGHADDRNDQWHGNNGRHRGWQKRAAWQDYNRYDYNRYEPRYGNYQADRYYRDGSYYQDRRLYNQDRIYRGSNDRYYCRRNDGTTGLIIGAAGGSLLGRAIARNGSKTLGTILGGAGGALIGRSIGRGGVRCN
jgi:Glycine zipper 2TM domain